MLIRKTWVWTHEQTISHCIPQHAHQTLGTVLNLGILIANFGFSLSCSHKNMCCLSGEGFGFCPFCSLPSSAAASHFLLFSACCLLTEARLTNFLELVTVLWMAGECVTITFPSVLSFVWTVLINNDPNNQVCWAGVLARPGCFWALAMEGIKLVLSSCAGVIDCDWMRSSFISRQNTCKLGQFGWSRSHKSCMWREMTLTEGFYLVLLHGNLHHLFFYGQTKQ